MTITLWKFTIPFQNLPTLEKSVALILVLRIVRNQMFGSPDLSLYNKANDPFLQ